MTTNGGESRIGSRESGTAATGDDLGIGLSRLPTRRPSPFYFAVNSADRSRFASAKARFTPAASKSVP